MIILTAAILVIVLIDLVVTVGMSLRLHYLSQALAVERPNRESVPSDVRQTLARLSRLG